MVGYFDVNDGQMHILRYMAPILLKQIDFDPAEIPADSKRRTQRLMDEAVESLSASSRNQPLTPPNHLLEFLYDAYQTVQLSPWEFGTLPLISTQPFNQNTFPNTYETRSRPRIDRHINNFSSGLAEVRKRSSKRDQTAQNLLEDLSSEPTSAKSTAITTGILKRQKCDFSSSGDVQNNDVFPPSGFTSQQAFEEFLRKYQIKPEMYAGVADMLLPLPCNVKESDICGMRDIKKLIRQTIISPLLRPELHKGLFRPPKGILLFGPPGSGKTLVAKWIASQTSASFFDVSPSSIISKYYGETESLVKALFQVAQAIQPSIIFIDEIDSILGSRQTGDDHSIRMKNQFLQVMDGISTQPEEEIVVVIGATNRPHVIDSAALRRFSKRLLVPLPDLENRKEQLRHLLKDHSMKMAATGDPRHEIQSSNQISAEAQIQVEAFGENGLASKEPLLEGGVSEAELEQLAAHCEGWNGSDLRSLCAKAAEYAYEETVMRYGSIEQVPGPCAFRSIAYADLQRAMQIVRPSASMSSQHDWSDWADRFGCS